MLENSLLNELSFHFPTDYPVLAEHFLERPAVDSLLRDAFKKPLTLVVAGAGYGKTQAVLSALKGVECKSVWIYLSDRDNLVDRFWEHISYSFKTQSNSLFDKMISLGYPESLASFEQFFRLLAEELSIEKQYIVIFDDFHLINNKSILHFFKSFITARMPNISIVLIARTAPELSLADMLSKGLLARITNDDLVFSRNEMDAYFHKKGFQLEEKMLSDIYSYTEGWIFAIYLVELSLKKGAVNNQNSILKARIDIFDLIEKEIFGSVSKKLQNFLIKIAMFDNLPSGLFKELIKNDSALINEMKKSNLLIHYDSLSDSYLFHSLFKEFLLDRKQHLAEDEIIEAHITASKWYLENNRRADALIHYKECNRYDEIFDIILSFSYHIARETANSFIEIIEQAPEEIVKRRPLIRVIKAYLLFNNNAIDQAKEELLKIRGEYEALPKTKDNLDILGEVYVTLAFISIVNNDYEFEEYFVLADECLPTGSKLITQEFHVADGLNFCNINDSSAGELKKHQDALFHIAPYAFRVLNGCAAGMAFLNAAESNLYTGNFKEAEKHAYEALYRAKQYQQYDIEYMANFVLVRLLAAKGKYTELFDILEQMKNHADASRIPICLSLNDIIRSWFFAKIEKTDAVAQWITERDGIPKTLAPVVVGREYLVRSDFLLAENRYYELLAFMEYTEELYKSRGILFAKIQNKITRAIVYHYLGNHEESMNELNEAYELAYPNNLVMQFIEYGSRMRTLIHAARLSEHCKIPDEWLNSIYTKSSSYAKQLSHIASTYDAEHALEKTDQIKLSKRETEVLTDLYHGLTRTEIATSSFLSISTINSVIKNIYDKLGALNVADAVRIAKKNKLI